MTRTDLFVCIAIGKLKNFNKCVKCTTSFSVSRTSYNNEVTWATHSDSYLLGVAFFFKFETYHDIFQGFKFSWFKSKYKKISVIWLLNNARISLILSWHRHLEEYCHAAHSQTQNKGFLADESQHAIFIWGTKWRPRKTTNHWAWFTSIITTGCWQLMNVLKMMCWLKSVRSKTTPRATTTQKFIYKKYHEPKIEIYKNCN